MAILNKHAALYIDYYELTTAQGYFLTGQHEAKTCFDYSFTKLPFKGGYDIFAGLEDLLAILQKMQFTKEDIKKSYEMSISGTIPNGMLINLPIRWGGLTMRIPCGYKKKY